MWGASAWENTRQEVVDKVDYDVLHPVAEVFLDVEEKPDGDLLLLHVDAYCPVWRDTGLAVNDIAGTGQLVQEVEEVG